MRWLLVAIVVFGNAFGDVLTTMGMKRHGEIEDLRPRHMVGVAFSVARNGHVLAGVASLAVSFFALLALLSITNVSFAIPATALGYLLETVLAKYLLKETVRGRRWAGAILVAVGVLLISLY